MTTERAILFIDGSNFYHATRKIDIVSGGTIKPWRRS